MSCQGIKSFWSGGFKVWRVFFSYMDSEGWVELRPGVMRRPLAVNEGWGLQADLIRIGGGVTDRPHTHDDIEWVYVLEGSFEDQAGMHVKGDFVVNSSEGVHQVTTGPGGCLLFIVWSGSVSEVDDGR
ncbi:MAG: hypothetical protein GF416_05030 [Candidatus Altiarchaeales archaeon]|nr:hypothetical protein [Candidatus Altiarchaeales archaeon]MBD3416480.1 hypothetical protein [Candidatus Altiarchaeales archaeon]